VGIATSPSDLIVILCRGSHSAATQLRVFPSCEPSFLRSASVTWVDFLGANSCAPITSHSPWERIYLSLVSCTWFPPYHGPLMGRICTRVSQQWRGYFTSQVYPLLVLELMALKPPFSSPCYCSELSRLDVSLRRRLTRAMSYFRRRLTRAMSLLRDASSGRPVGFSSLGPLRGPTMCLTLTSGQGPGTGHFNIIYSLIIHQYTLLLQQTQISRRKIIMHTSNTLSVESQVINSFIFFIF